MVRKRHALSRKLSPGIASGGTKFKLKQSWGEQLFDYGNYVLMFILSLLFLYPLWDTLMLSFTAAEESQLLGLRLLPRGFSLAAYREVFKDDLIFIGYGNTLFRVVLGTLLTIMVTFVGGYVLTKKEMPLHNTILLLITFTMFFSGGLIPVYLQIKRLGLLGSRWSLILPLATSAWNLIIARNFIRTIPPSLEESAFIDGATPPMTLLRIIMPLSAPIMAVLALWTAVAHWNAWFDAMIYVRSPDKIVLQLALRLMLIEENIEIMGGDALLTMTDETSPETIKAATIIVSIAPILCLYPYLQRFFVKGIMVGSIKG